MRQTPDVISPPIDDLTRLPPPVVAIRAKILAACATQDIEALRIPIDWNEMRPLFAKSGAYAAGADPIEILKSQSFDGRGREMLRLIPAIFAQPYVMVTRGALTLYEWPAFARVEAASTTEAERRAQWRCVRFAELMRSNSEGRPRATRIGVAADGVWHYLWSETA